VKLGLRIAMGLSAAGMLGALALLGRLRITAFDQDLDLSPHRDSPHAPTAIPLEAGPILVQVEYTVPVAQKETFMEAMIPVRRLRLRDGAMRWALFEEPDQPLEGAVRLQETYLSSTMGEHLRQHHRATAQDRAVLAEAFRFTEGGQPTTRHLVVVEDHDSSLLQKIWQGWVGE